MEPRTDLVRAALERTAGVQPARREQVFMPHCRSSGAAPQIDPAEGETAGRLTAFSGQRGYRGGETRHYQE